MMPGQTLPPRAEGERSEPAHAHTGDDDGADPATAQPFDRRLQFAQAVEKRAVTPAPIRPAHLRTLDRIASTIQCRGERSDSPKRRVGVAMHQDHADGLRRDRRGHADDCCECHHRQEESPHLQPR
jgi:hypothetical protein